jgi:CRISPR type I-A-associated protein Csa5
MITFHTPGVTLQTPGTGFDDFESRIALGLCRVALDCVEPEQVLLEENFDRYLVQIDIGSDETIGVGKALSNWGIKALSSEDTLNKIPGFRPKEIYDHKNKEGKLTVGYSKKMVQFSQKLFKDPMTILSIYLTANPDRKREGAHASTCGHIDSDPIFNAILGMSPQIGKPYKRDNITNRINLHLCASCGVLALLGKNSFQTGVIISRNDRLTREKYFFIPRFRGQTSGDTLSAYIAAIKRVQPRLNNIPSSSALLAILSSYPHIGRVIQKRQTQASIVPSFFVARADTSGNAPRYQRFEERNIDSELMFLGNNSYNVALAQRAYAYADNKPEIISLLSKALHFRQDQDAISFCREYVSMGEGRRLVYKESAKYIVKEVLGMDEKIVDDVNIGAVASMLRFFVSKQKFGYVDNLRGSRTLDEFEKHLLSAQRDAASIYGKSDDKKDKDERWLYLPSDSNIREFLRLAGKHFEQVRTLTCILAFTYWKKEG